MEADFLTSSTGLVSRPEAAAFLADIARVEYLKPFLAQECTVSQAARQTGLSIAKMSYWVRKMQGLGLVHLVRTKRRKGSPVKVFRSTAQAFVVPLEAIPAESDFRLLESIERPRWHNLLRSLAETGRKNAEGWHMRVWRADGLVVHSVLPESGEIEQARIFNWWMRLRLRPEQAKAFRGELERLMHEYLPLSLENRKQELGAEYLSHLVIVEEAGGLPLHTAKP